MYQRRLSIRSYKKKSDDVPSTFATITVPETVLHNFWLNVRNVSMIFDEDLGVLIVAPSEVQHEE